MLVHIYIKHSVLILQIALFVDYIFYALYSYWREYLYRQSNSLLCLYVVDMSIKVISAAVWLTFDLMVKILFISRYLTGSNEPVAILIDGRRC